jgi:hypothetical protein
MEGEDGGDQLRRSDGLNAWCNPRCDGMHSLTAHVLWFSRKLSVHSSFHHGNEEFFDAGTIP